MELAEIKKALASRAEEVCRHLLPNGKISGGEWEVGGLGGEAGSSLKIKLTGDKAGLWRDFAGDVGSNNLLELWIQVRSLEFLPALNEAKAWLGQHGVNTDHDLRGLRKKTQSKPEKKGIVHINNRVEAYLYRERKIPLEVIREFKLGMKQMPEVFLKEADIEITADEHGEAIVYPYCSEEQDNAAQMIKYVMIGRNTKGKKVSWTSKDTAKVLFGKHTRAPGDRSLLISEGEIDAMTWKAMRIPGLCCTSVPFGAKWEGKDGRDPNDEWIANDWEFISSFERIYLSMDMDEEGRKAQASIIKRLGREVCFVITLPTKDANELLKANRAAELRKAFDAAKTLDPETLKNAAEFRQNVLDRLYSGDANVKKGIPLPFGNQPFHLRWNEWTAVTGQNGSGKTQLLGHLLIYLWKLGYPCCVGSFEVPVGQTLAFYVSQTCGVKLPERPLGERALDWLAGGFWFYDHVGQANWRDVLETFRYAYRRHGCRFFVIDSWMKMGIKDDDYETQGEVLDAISDFARDCDVHVFVVAHPRKGKDEIQQVGKMDIKGSGEITDQAHNVWVVWRNKGKEAAIEKMVKFKEDDHKILAFRKLHPDARLAVQKQKNDDGDEPTIELWFVKGCKQYFHHFTEEGRCILDAQEAAPPEPTAPVAQENLDEDVPF